jgi:tetratricopeptide (TPR) repeat protein
VRCLQPELPSLKNVPVLLAALFVLGLAFLFGSCGRDVPPSRRENPSASSSVSVSDGVKPPSSERRAEVSGDRTARGRDQFVGSAACVECHKTQSEAYLPSHHAKALVSTKAEAEKAHFDGTRFNSKYGGITTFALTLGVPVVNTPTSKGKTSTLPVPYVSGVWPLQQYVVDTERGKLQSLGVAWDSRSAAAGGSRWFHVYGSEGIAPHDPLFFTGAAQNWNHMCADCHSTWVERRYDPATDAFDTKWAELSVGCEACHGPGAEHVKSAQENAAKPVKFAASLRPAAPWMPSATGSPTPRIQNGVEVEACAPCHSRRAPLAERFIASDLLLDNFEPELLWPGRYHADGQVEGEVYEWGSFTQSRMYQAGVTCSDCHDPHSGKPYATGDALCVRCHEPARFQSTAHSHHTGAEAPNCIDCHMPPATFMQIDERRDHSIRVPRPDHSVAFGTPNACTTCHTQQTAVWAREWSRNWFPSLEERSHFVEALAKERQGEPDAHQALRKLALDPAAPPIARATALERLGSYPGTRTAETLRAALAATISRGGSTSPGRVSTQPGSEALVVFGAALGAAQLAPTERAPLLLDLLSNEVRAVRLAAGKALAGVSPVVIPNKARADLERVFAEVEQSFAVSASRAETHVEASAFELARGRIAQAEAALQTALRLEPCLSEAHLNVAELERQRKNEQRAEDSIRTALTCNPNSAAAHHALGLWYVRAKRHASALTSLTKAVELEPGDARFSYVLAVALAGNQKNNDAIRVLEASLKKHPNDIQSLQALSQYLGAGGQTERAASARRRLATLLRE